MCLRLPFAPGISQAWDSTQVPRHGRPHQVNRRSRERQVQRGSSGSLGRLPFHSSSPPFCDAVRCLVVGLRLFSPLSSPFTLGLLTELSCGPSGLLASSPPSCSGPGPGLLSAHARANPQPSLLSSAVPFSACSSRPCGSSCLRFGDSPFSLALQPRVKTWDYILSTLSKYLRLQFVFTYLLPV